MKIKIYLLLSIFSIGSIVADDRNPLCKTLWSHVPDPCPDAYVYCGPATNEKGEQGVYGPMRTSKVITGWEVIIHAQNKSQGNPATKLENGPKFATTVNEGEECNCPSFVDDRNTVRNTAARACLNATGSPFGYVWNGYNAYEVMSGPPVGQ